MRNITKEVVNAFLHRTPKRKSNTFTNGDALFLHHNKIAEFRHDGLYITNAGWQTVTTKERLNALPDVSIRQKNHVWYLNGNQWDGSWIMILPNFKHLATGELLPLHAE